MKLNRETKVGIFAAIAISILYFGFNFLKGKKFFSSYNTYYVLYDNIEGITNSTAIFINGFKVGQVEQISLPDESVTNRILVRLFINKKIKVSRSTTAKIVSQDLLGTKAINLMIPDLAMPLTDGDTLKGEREMDLSTSLSNSLSPIKDKSEQVLVTLDKVLGSLRNVFDEKGTQNLTSGLIDLSAAIKNLRHMTEKMDQIVETSKLEKTLSNMESITSNLKNNNAELSGTLKNLNTISDSLSQSNLKSTVNNVNKLSEELAILLQKINKGEGSLGMVANDKQLYTNLTKTLDEMQLLLNDMRKNPSRYVHFSLFGGSSKKEKTSSK